MTKRQDKIAEIEKIGVSRSKADTITAMFEELFNLRASGLKRDLVGMEEVKTRLKRKGEAIDEMKILAEEKRKRVLMESRSRKHRSSSRISSMSPNPMRVSTMRSGMHKLVSFNAP